MTGITKTTKPIKEKDISRQWYLFDLAGQVLGRVAGKIAKLLQGKHKTNYVDYLDSGDFVVVVNAVKVKVTGRKNLEKIYTRYSGYPGGLKKINFSDLLIKKPEEIIKRAVSGMLPKNKLRAKRLTRLFIYPDEKHPYHDKFEARNPKSQINSKL